MTGKSPEDRQILDAQAAILTGTLEHAGYTYIEPEILQPAEVFLDRSGEDIRLRTYVVNHTPEKLEPVGMALGEFWGDVTPAPNTWLGVQGLALPEFLVEIEGTAVLP